MLRTVLLLTLFLAPLCYGERTPLVQPEDLAKLRAGKPPAVLLDVRTDREHRAGAVPGSRNIPVAELSDRLADLAPHKKTPAHRLLRIRHSRRPRRKDSSGTAGFQDVRHLAGDMRGWREAGREQAKPPKSAP